MIYDIFMPYILQNHKVTEEPHLLPLFPFIMLYFVSLSDIYILNWNSNAKYNTVVTTLKNHNINFSTNPKNTLLQTIRLFSIGCCPWEEEKITTTTKMSGPFSSGVARLESGLGCWLRGCCKGTGVWDWDINFALAGCFPIVVPETKGEECKKAGERDKGLPSMLFL